jgi:photosystem II stability/assembly factor-like uncharacterized protein
VKRLSLIIALLLAPSLLGAQRRACGVWTTGQTVVVSAGDTIRRSTDGGATWTDIALGTPKHFPVCAITGAGANVVAVGYLDQIYHSADTGRTWTAIQAPSDNTDDLLHDAWASGNTFLAVGNNMEVLQSTDGGVRWAPVPLPTGRGLFAIVGVAGSGDTVVAVTTKHVLRSTDVGWHWKEVWIPDGFVFHEVWADGATFIAIGSWETIVRSVDGAVTWTVVRRVERPAPIVRAGGIEFPGAGSSLNDIWGHKRTWIIVGNDGLILRSTDGGEQWTTVPSGTRKDLQTVALTPFGLLAAGSDVYGEVRLRSTDGGATWQPLP